jgi:hypothetical protein
MVLLEALAAGLELALLIVVKVALVPLVKAIEVETNRVITIYHLAVVVVLVQRAEMQVEILVAMVERVQPTQYQALLKRMLAAVAVVVDMALQVMQLRGLAVLVGVALEKRNPEVPLRLLELLIRAAVVVAERDITIMVLEVLVVQES